MKYGRLRSISSRQIRQHLALRRLLLGDAPAQVHLGKGDKALVADPAQIGKHRFDQQLPLLLHVAEGGGDEDADLALGEGIGFVTRRCSSG